MIPGMSKFVYIAFTFLFLARKQMKRKSDCMEDKQREVIKKLKGEDGSPKATMEKRDDVSKEQASETENKEDTNEDKCCDKEELMEGVEREEEKQTKKEEKSTSARPKPTTMHSFFGNMYTFLIFIFSLSFIKC